VCERVALSRIPWRIVFQYCFGVRVKCVSSQVECSHVSGVKWMCLSSNFECSLCLDLQAMFKRVLSVLNRLTNVLQLVIDC
jgi:hypothetical protein